LNAGETPSLQNNSKIFPVFGGNYTNFAIMGGCAKKIDLDITGKIDIINTIGKIGKAGRNG
jgi:hypothetical protein